ncbi:MAG TPA: purine-nucleoside phosphorylase [Gemmatimonadales bacterium]|nr:purine-nucleoside phosphorylase [Gemmatimonadales bacterium]
MSDTSGARDAMIEEAAGAVRKRLEGRAPTVAIVLGSGLGHLADEVQQAVRVPYAQIPGFPQPSVAGHRGELVAGTLEDMPVLVQSGRFHLYEGHSVDVAALPVRVFARLGVRTLIVTNAAGGVRPTFRAGTLMLIADHVNLMFRNPLIGPVLQGEERFPDMSEPYDAGLRALARQAAREAGIALEEGVYVGLLGPSYETPAEIRMLQRLGIDAVGMSTVPEVIVARARGIRCLGFSTITNLAAGISPTKLSHAEVLDVGRQMGQSLAAIVRGVVRLLPGA